MTTRQRILTHLKKTHSASAREMARALNLSAPNVRHHLGVLVADGRVTVLRQRAAGRGRPVKVYGLAPALEGDNLAALVEALLTESSVQMDALAKRLLDADAFSGQPAAKRLALIVEKLNAMKYQARWEAGAEGPRVIFGRCPYAAVIEGHPELCRMDASLLENALEKKVRQLGKIEKAQGTCVFATM